MQMNLSVVIVTLNRIDCLKVCMEHLRDQDAPLHEVIVVDGSMESSESLVKSILPNCIYLHTKLGYSRMAASRNRGLKAATGDIVAFLDDDSFAYPNWAHEIVKAFERNPLAGGIGGRALNGLPGESTIGLDAIGKFTCLGMLTGNFAADPGEAIEVDHIIGCNMAWRSNVLAQLDPLNEDYRGTEVREETDIAFRVRALGYKLVFCPQAVVRHIGAPQSKGRRFDLRYVYYSQRNHLLLLHRHRNLTGGKLLTYVLHSTRAQLWSSVKQASRAILAIAAHVVGIAGGGAAIIRLYIARPSTPAPAPASTQHLSPAP